MPANNDSHRYDDIINLPHHQSPDRPHMSMHDRAAQFAPFAALTGHAAAIAETVRLTDKKIELDEYAIAALDNRLKQIRKELSSHPVVSLTYFCPDDKKSGGAYLTKTGVVKNIDDFEKTIVFADGTRIPVADIIEIEYSSQQVRDTE